MKIPSDGVDDRYRRASAREVGRPSESVRRAVLQHAADLAAQRASAKQPVDVDFKRRAANQAWRRPAAYGGLAAAALAGLLIAPRFLTPSSPPAETAKTEGAGDTPIAAGAPAPTPSPAAEPAAPAPAAAPQPAAAPDGQRRLQAQSNDRERLSRGQAGSLAAYSAGASAAKSSAQDASRAEQLRAGDNALAESAPPPAEPFARQSGAKPAAPAALFGGRAAASRPDAASALRQAAALGDLPRLRALLAEQPEIDARDDAGRTALMLAVLYGQTDVVNTLLTSGADANAADSNGTTPLQAALARNRSAIVDALRRAGAR